MVSTKILNNIEGNKPSVSNLMKGIRFRGSCNDLAMILGGSTLNCRITSPIADPFTANDLMNGSYRKNF